MTDRGKLYFASDFHFGVPSDEKSREREHRVIRWLDHIAQDASEIYLVGDMFDFWFEYRHAIPKGFVRFQGKIAELTDKGIAVHFFTGNHDMWMFDYFPKELGVTMHREPISFVANNKRFLVGHGDGLGPGDKGYKFIKSIFSNRFFQWCFARVHPNVGIGVANFFSRKSRAKTGADDEVFKGEENEWLLQYCKASLTTQPTDYFIFGHRHLPLDIVLENGSRYLNLGEWINYNTYAVFDGEELLLNKFEN